MIKIPYFILFIFFQAYNFVHSQCCSIGIPTAGTVNIGIVPEGFLRINSFYRFSFSDSYYKANQLYSGPGTPLKSSNYHYVGATVSYGIINNFTIELESGYFLSKMQEREINGERIKSVGYGLSNLIISAKYNVLNLIEEDFEITVGLGPKLPFTREPQYVENVKLPDDIQPSTNAFGAVIQLFMRKGLADDWGLFLNHRTEINTTNNRDFRYGNLYSTSLFLSRQFGSGILGLIQIRNDIKSKDELHSELLSNTGNIQIILSPQVNYTIDSWNFSLLFDYPVYRYYNERQLANKYSVAFNVNMSFSLMEDGSYPD
jgi:hypothetical protein